ncbi:PREDICTED: uncharacterized protein LOC104737195 [Camelina sativa]|uniref:Uncharacterized protein LOC104737195 n=1 Tax=Camelina sativa TaxID=90675 RepID=A0ABM1QUN2_CAMSA|nr:PREDICTED: uncharacterized protein LOC104737195 [Camelina sativa]
MTIEDFVSQPGRELIAKLHPNYIGDSTCKRMEEFSLSQPSVDGNGLPTPILVDMINKFVLEETPQTKCRILQKYFVLVYHIHHQYMIEMQNLFEPSKRKMTVSKLLRRSWKKRMRGTS